MDRFIEYNNIFAFVTVQCLKSNMDRFIDQKTPYTALIFVGLKSNMDRFIVLAAFVGLGLISV